MFRKILIPTDGTGLEDHVIRYAAEMFPFAEFHVISVVNTRAKGIQLTTLLTEMLEKTAQDAISHAVKVLVQEGVQPSAKKVIIGIPSQSIHQYACENGIDLIALRSYARHGIQSYKLGGTIENTLKLSKIPILIMSSPAKGHRPKSILLATDGTKGSQNAENVAILYAASTNSELNSIFVRATNKENSEKVIKNISWKAKQHKLKCNNISVTGDPVKSIIEIAKEHDIVIMGTGRKGWFSKIVIGHVSRQVVVASPKPVILVRGRFKR